MGIPKIIHYCWFGRGELTEKSRTCIESWSKVCPDYKIVRWDEDNFDVNCCDYVREAYETKHYAFVSDYARFYAIKQMGGLYLDTDVEAIRPFDELLDTDVLISGKSVISDGFDVYGVTSGIIGSVKDSRFVDDMIARFHEHGLKKEDGSLDVTPVAKHMTDYLIAKGFALDDSLQKKDGVTLYPCEYFCPRIDRDNNSEVLVTDETRTIHFFAQSWMTPEIHEILIEKLKNRKPGEIVG
ncbi:MAG: glycosyl transferase [Clostridiales bacterium]|nr:glycosyl transferase [Clostridiales bacterium]